jgi:3-isopropylmalate/(R)-2-methylmalate dehydratase small subunit
MSRVTVVLVLGDDVSTDIVYPGRFMATVLPSETPQFAFADDAAFNRRVRAGEIPPGSVVVAGANFGCGSSREQAVSCLKGHGLIVVARHVARIFLQNAINLGLPIVICPTIEAQEGDEIEVQPDAVVNHSTDRSFPIQALPTARQAIIEAGGLIPYTRQRLLEGRGASTPLPQR